jgi:hypothetical protein
VGRIYRTAAQRRRSISPYDLQTEDLSGEYSALLFYRGSWPIFSRVEEFEKKTSTSLLYPSNVSPGERNDREIVADISRQRTARRTPEAEL